MRILATRLRLRILRSLARAPSSVWAALGAMAGFYPALPRPPSVFLLALISGAAALPFLEVPPEAGIPRGPSGRPSCRASWRLLSRAALALCFGLALGASARLSESGSRAPPELGRFSPMALSGRLASDARRTASGNTALVVELDSLILSLPGSRLSLSWPRHSPRLSLIAGAEGSGLGSASGLQDLVAGQRLSAGSGAKPASGRLSLIDASKALVYSPGKDCRAEEGRGFASRFRRRLRKGFAAAIRRISGSSYPLAQALILGIKDELDGEESAMFRDAGCAHILALSGQHLSILFALSALIVEKGLRRPRLAGWASLAIAFGFTWLAGPGPSLLRASLSTTLAFVLKRIDRPQGGLPALSTIFCLCLALRPPDARSLSFTLSYAAMFGLIVLASRWENFLWRLPPFLSKALAPSLAALCATAPISLSVFGRLAVGGIVSATLSGPLVLLFMWSLLASCALGSVLPFLAPILGAWHQILHWALLRIMELGASLPAIEAGGASASAGGAAALALSAPFVLIGVFVYAWPHVEWAFRPFELEPRARPGGRRSFLALLRFPPIHPRLPGGSRPGHDQALRPELPRR